MDDRAFLELNGPAYRLAVRALGSAEGAEDVIQQAYLAAVTRLHAGQPPADLRSWFLKVVSNIARKQRRGEAVRKRREATVVQDAASAGTHNGGDVSQELIAVLRGAMSDLEDDYRLPVALCCEEGLTQQEAADILDIPQPTLSRRVRDGLERLRAALKRAGYESALPVVAGALAHTAPAVPAGLAAALEKMVSEKVAGLGSGAGSAGAAVGVAAKGGMAMKAILAVLVAGTVAAGAAGLSAFGFRSSEPRDTGDGPPTIPVVGSNPVTEQQSREEVFEFSQKPTVTKQGPSTSSGQATWAIAFTSKGKCDATVAIVDGQGRIVRHLASGVLGANAPWPFKQGSLAQSIEWDGKDDFGKPAPAGCKVKVALGVKYIYERSMGWTPGNFGSSVQSIVVAKDGTAYVVAMGEIKAFDREGKYLRTLFPPQGSVDVSGAFPMLKTAAGDSVIMSDWKGPFDSIKGSTGTCALTGDESKLLVYFNKADNRQPVSLLKIDTKTGSLPPGSVVNIGHTYDYQKVGLGVASVNSGGVNISIAVAADGETAYFSGAQHAVFKAKLGDLKHRGSLLWPSRGEKIPPETMPNLFLGEAGKPGDDNAHFNMTRGIGLDEEGNIYVGDHLNDRIQVFKADGTHLRTLKVNAPQEIAVHPKTGNIYALCWRSGDVMKPPKSNVILQPRIVKVSKDGSPSAAVIELKADWNFWHNPHGICLGLDATGSEPAIWVADKQGIRKFADKGGSFAEVGRIAGGGGVGASGSLQRLAVDNETEALYFSSGSRIFNPGWYRFDGNTGKRDESFKGGGWEDMAIASDGTIVCRTPGYGRFVVRYDRDLKPLPFKDGVAPTDVPAGWPAGGKALYCGVQGHSNVHQSGLTVNPVTGDLLVRAKEINKEWWEKVAPGGNSLPAEELAGLAGWLPPSLSKSGAPEAGGLGGILLVWDAEGRPKTVQAITGLVRGQGVRADSGGNLYMGCGYDPTGAGWFGLAEPKKLTGYRSFGNLGSVFKFVSKGTYPIGSMEDKKSPAGAAWVYTGHAPCEPGDCGCAHSRFGLDRFGRAYIPSMQLYSVMVLDANGNVVLRLGRYGNADSQGKGSLVPEPDIGLGWVLAVEASDKAVYIGDQGNARILKAAIGYAAEETVPAP